MKKRSTAREQEALGSVAALDERNVTLALARNLRSKHWRVRVATVEALAALGAVQEITGLTDSDPDVQLAVERALDADGELPAIELAEWLAIGPAAMEV